MKKEYVEKIERWSAKNGADCQIFPNKAIIYFEGETWVIIDKGNDLYEVRHGHSQQTGKFHTHRQAIVDERDNISAMDYILEKMIKTHNPYKRPKLDYIGRMRRLFDSL